MATYRYNVVIEMGIDTDGLSQGKAKVKSQLHAYEKEAIESQRRIDNELKRGSQQTQQHLKGVDDALGKSRSQLGMWGTAFKGAFIGAVAGITFSVIVSGITDITRALVEGGIESVRYAAKLEETTNALAVFTGSTRSARRELADIDEVARNTTGLRLEPAEEGFQRLRALGFQAKLSQGFIKELGEEKILSGASDEALGKIIFNFAQIASGGQKVSQELREIVTQMPTLQRAFFNAFGTLDPKKIQAFFDKDTEAAFGRLVDAMAKGKQATGGLNDAFGKLADEFIVIGRLIGEPTLEGLTTDVKDLTQFLRDNKDVWMDWGVTLADILRGVSSEIRTVNGELTENQMLLSIISKGAGLIVGGFHPERLIPAPGLGQRLRPEVSASKKDYVQQIFEANRNTFDKNFSIEKLSEADLNYILAIKDLIKEIQNTPASEAIKRNKLLAKFENLPPPSQELGGVRLSTDNALDTLEERQAKFVEQEAKRVRESAKHQEQSLRDLQAYFVRREQITANGFEVERALLDLTIRNTTADELNYIRKATTLRRSQLETELAQLKESYTTQINLLGGNKDEQIKKQNEFAVALSEKNKEIQLNEIEGLKRTQEIERQIRNERRQAQIEFVSLQIRENQQAYGRQIADTERFIQNVSGISNEGYAELIRLTNESYLQIYEYTAQTFALRLSDEKLGNQERINLQKEMNLELQRLEEDNRQKILQIQERQYKNQLERLDRFASEFSRRVGNATNQISAVSDSLNIGGVDSQLVRNIGQSFFGGDIDQLKSKSQFDLAAAKAQHEQLVNVLPKLDAASDAYRDLKLKLEIINAEIDYHEGALKKLNDSYPEWLTNIYKTVKGYQDGTISLEEFQKAQIGLFDKQTTAKIIDYNNQIDTLNVKITEATKAGNLSDLKKFNAELENLQLDKTLFSFDAANKRAELFSKTIEGLTEKIKKLREADPNTIRQLNDVFRIENLAEQEAQYKEIYRLKYDIANSPYIDSLEVEKAYLEDIIELRGRETEAIIRSNKAKLEIADKFVYSKNRADADVEEFLASQKGITDILSEARINVITQAFNGLDAVAMSLSKNFGFAKDAVQQLISSLLRLVAIPLIQRAFGLGGGTGTGGFGGFGIPGIGNIGVGGTAPFNPNLQQFINPALGGSNQPVNSDFLSGMMSQYGAGGVNYAGQPRGVLGTANATFGIGGGGQGGFLSQLFSGQGIGSAIATAGISIGIQSLVASLQTHSPLKGFLMGGAVGLIAGILNRNRRRRREEKLRDTAIRDAFKAIDKLIEDVKTDKINGDSALSQAEQIRQQYVESMNQLKDRKTREHALADVSRIDAKIGELKSAIANQMSRRERLEMLVPTFGEGGRLSSFIGRNYRNNPLGYRNEPESIGYFRYNEKGSEYIIDHETTHNVGTYHLDNMRATKGESFKSLLRNSETSMPSRATGGSISQTFVPSSAPANTNSNGASIVDVQVVVNGVILTDDLANALTVVLKKSDGTTELKNLSTALKTDGQEFLDTLINQLRAKGFKIS